MTVETTERLNWLMFHMKNHDNKVYLVGDLRGVGKTTALVELAKDQGGVYVNTTEYMAKNYASALEFHNYLSIDRLSSLRGLDKRLFVDEGCVSAMIEKSIYDDLDASDKIIGFFRTCDKVIMNRKDYEAVLRLKMRLEDSFRAMLSYWVMNDPKHEKTMDTYKRVLKELNTILM